MNRKILIYSLFFVFLGQFSMAQEAPIYSQYMLNGFLLNPAIAGSEGYSAVNITAREQWIGLDDGPGTYAVSFQTRMLRRSYISKNSSVKKRQRYSSRSGKVGVGGYIYNDVNGQFRRTGIKTSYAYHLFFGNSQLSFGLSLSLLQLSIDEQGIIFHPGEGGDLVWQNAMGTTFVPDADLGVYYDTPDFYVGFSVDQLLESGITLGSASASFGLERNYYLMAGYDFPIADYLVLTPSTLTKFSEVNNAFQTDINLKLYYDQTYWGGLTFRTGPGSEQGTALIVLAGLSIDKWIFGYAYDFSFSSLMKGSGGSHEFIFAAKFGDSARRYRWLNRY